MDMDDIPWPTTGYIPTIYNLINRCTNEYARFKSDEFTLYLDQSSSQFKEFSKNSVIKDLITNNLSKIFLTRELIEHMVNEASFNEFYSMEEKSAADTYPRDNSFCSFLKAFFQRNIEISIDCFWVKVYFIVFLLYPLILGVTFISPKTW